VTGGGRPDPGYRQEAERVVNGVLARHPAGSGGLAGEVVGALRAAGLLVPAPETEAGQTAFDIARVTALRVKAGRPGGSWEEAAVNLATAFEQLTRKMARDQR
jgi:hypothetical protein